MFCIEEELSPSVLSHEYIQLTPRVVQRGGRRTGSRARRVVRQSSCRGRRRRSCCKTRLLFPRARASSRSHQPSLRADRWSVRRRRLRYALWASCARPPAKGRSTAFVRHGIASADRVSTYSFPLALNRLWQHRITPHTQQHHIQTLQHWRTCSSPLNGTCQRFLWRRQSHPAWIVIVERKMLRMAA